MRKTLFVPPLWFLLSLLLLGWCMWAEAGEPYFNDPYYPEIFGDRLKELNELRSRVTPEERARLLEEQTLRLLEQAEQCGVQVDVYREQVLERTVFFPEGAAAYWVQWPDGRIEKREMDGRTFIEQGRTYVPVRYLACALGVRNENVLWDGAAQKVTLKEPGFPTVEMTVGVVGVLSDGRPVPGVDVPPVLRQLPAWRTYLPARWTAQALGYQVDWDKDGRIAVVWRSGPRPEVPEQVRREAEEVRREASNWVTTELGYRLPNPKGGLIDRKLSAEYPEGVCWTKAGLKIDARSLGDGVELDLLVMPPDYKGSWEAYDQAEAILVSKFGQDFASEVMAYVRQKKSRWDKLEGSKFFHAPTGHSIVVDVGEGTQIEVWAPGVRPPGY